MFDVTRHNARPDFSHDAAIINASASDALLP